MEEKYLEFKKTKKLYEEATPDVNYPVTYAEWLQLPDEHKPSAFFVSFYEPIMCAVRKYDYLEINEPDMISVITTRIFKEMEHIKSDPKKYNSNMAVTMAVSSMVEYDRGYNHRRSSGTLNMSTNIGVNPISDEEYNMYDYTPTNEEYEPLPNKALQETREMMYEMIASNDKDLLKMIDILIENKRIPDNFKRKYPAMAAELRKKFAKQASYFHDIHLDCETFEDVINNEDLIRSCTVILEDGTEAVWFAGDKAVYKNGTTRYTLLTKNDVRYIPTSRAIKLKVIDVEAIDEI